MSERNAEIYYYDIGDYLSREQKLNIISQFKSMENLPFTRITSNEHGDWISQRNDKFATWLPIEADKKFNSASQSFFTMYSLGIATNKDYLLYDFGEEQLNNKVQKMVDFYNEQRILFYTEKIKSPSIDARSFIKYDIKKINWTDLFIRDLEKNQKYELDKQKFTIGMYRPFCKQRFIYEKQFLQRTYQQLSIFPTANHKNLVICVTGIGSTKVATALMTDMIPSLDYVEKSQCFPLYWYETIEPKQHSLFDDGAKIVRHEAISDFILDRAREKYGNKVQREDIFYYVYGILHSKSYRETFSADLKKMLPRIPLVSNWQKFWAFSEAGRSLADLHLNYEEVAPYPNVQVDSLKYAQYASDRQCGYDDGLIAAAPSPQALSESEIAYNYYAVEQMKFPKKGEKGTILYNHWHTIKNIPEKAYEYVVNGKSAIEWIMERYAVTTDKKSGIKNDPNDWSREHQKPRYILDLLLSVINVSVQTVDIVNGLPEVDWDKE